MYRMDYRQPAVLKDWWKFTIQVKKQTREIFARIYFFNIKPTIFKAIERQRWRPANLFSSMRKERT